MRFALPAAILVVLVLLAGCGDSSEETPTGKADGRGVAQEVKADWEQSRGLQAAAGRVPLGLLGRLLPLPGRRRRARLVGQLLEARPVDRLHHPPRLIPRPAATEPRPDPS